MICYFYVDLEGKVHNCETDDKLEIERIRNQFGNVFFTRIEAVEFSMQPKEKPCRSLTDEEMREIDKQQMKFGWSQMTEEERREARERRKSLDQLQLEFGREMERRARLGLA